MEHKQCFLCGRNGRGDRLELHHIFSGSNRRLSDKYGLVVWLCGERCHRLGKYSAHQNARTAEYLHKYGQRKCMQEQGWTVGKFISVFGKSYI